MPAALVTRATTATTTSTPISALWRVFASQRLWHRCRYVCMCRHRHYDRASRRDNTRHAHRCRAARHHGRDDIVRRVDNLIAELADHRF